MRVLVTGGAGYVGSHICEQLVRDGHYAVAYDDLSTGAVSNVKRRRDLIFVRGDIANIPLLSQIMMSKGIDAVIHCAAKSLVSESFDKPADYMATNVMGTLAVLQAMQLSGVQHIVATSSCAVYGLVDATYIEETTPVAPISPYGVSKLAMEGLLETTFPDIKAVSLRCFNIAGAESWYMGRMGDTHLIPRLVQAAMGLVPSFTVFGTNHLTTDGTCVRDYTHVTDVATAHIMALKWLQKGGYPTVFNVGMGKGLSVRAIIDECKLVLPLPVEVIYGPGKPGDPSRLVAGTYDIRSAVEWFPRQRSLTSMIQTTWDSYQYLSGFKEPSQQDA